MMLHLESFEKNMQKLATRFNKKITTGLLDLYYDRVENIPEGPFIEIIYSFIDNAKTFPTPGEFKSAWFEWLQYNPGKYIGFDKPREDCDECSGKGYHDVEYIPKFILDMYKLKYPDADLMIFWDDPLSVYSAVVNCSSCKHPKFGTKVVQRMSEYKITDSRFRRVVHENEVSNTPIKNKRELVDEAFTKHGKDMGGRIPF